MNLKCFHCGEPVPADTHWNVTYRGEDRAMCCIGCQAIAKAIIDAGAASYYENRSTEALDAKTLESLAPWALLLNDPQWTAQHVQSDPTESTHAQTTLAIDGLRCGACAWLIEKILAQTPGVLRAQANASTERLFVQWNTAITDLATIAQRVGSVGYALLPIGSTPIENIRRTSERKALRRLFIAGLSSAQIMMYAYPEYLEGGGLDDDVRSLMRTASLLITVPVMVYSATPFFESAWRMLKQRRLGMDVPVSLGLLIAFFASVWSWATNTGEVYFDSVSMFVFLLLGARWIEAKIRARTSAQRERLSTAIPALAQRVSPSPGAVAPWNLQINDVVRIGSGERVAADGRLLSERTELDCSWLTGESLPVAIARGERVTEGSINLGPAIEICIDTPVSQGTLSRLSQLAEQAATDRPQWIAWADRVGAIFTAAILLITAALIIVSVLQGVAVADWLPAVIAVLVVTCPCALSMAGPTAYAAALAKLLENGIAVSNSQTLERLTSVSDVVFDKTGTLTDPTHADVTMVFGAPTLWPLVAAVAAESSHPLAIAIARTARKEISARHLAWRPSSQEHSQFHAGLGVSTVIQGDQIRLGALHFVADPSDARARPDTAAAASQCTVFLSVNGELRAGFSIDDTPRPEAASVIANVKQLGHSPWCLSGDQQPRVDRIAQALDIPADQAVGQCTPSQKKERVGALQASGHVVMMVGDGHNDAPVLAQADVSIAVFSAAPLAKQKADIFLLHPNLSGVADVTRIALRARQLLNQNLAWALAYNLVAIPFAAAGMISPLVASIGMAASSLLVVLNSARLLR